MKHLIARTLTSLMLAVVGLAVAAPAQTTQVIQVNIPFEFNFGDRTFPAGEYSLVEPQQHLLVLRDSRGRMVAQRLTAGVESVTSVEGTKLKFTSNQGQHFLAEVWQQGNSAGLQLSQPKARNVVAKNRSIEARQTAEGSQP